MITQKILNSFEYVKIAYMQDKRTKEFFRTSYIFNNNTGEISKIKFDKDWHLRQSYLYNTFRIDYLNQECINSDMIPIFITLTLPAEYHPSSKNYNPEFSVNDGYRELQNIFRSVYNDFKFNRKRVDLKFIRVIEPHKSWIPHLHAIVYVPTQHKQLFLGHLNRIIKRYELKQTDIKVLDTAKYAVTYLLKYIDKTLSGSDEIRGWKIHHEIKRSLTMSNLNNGITRNIFKRASDFISFDKKDEDSYLHQILKKFHIERYQIDENRNIIKSQVFGNEHAKYSILETIQVYNKISDLTFDEKINIQDCMIYEDEKSYRLVELVVFEDMQEVWNMRDYDFYQAPFFLEPELEFDYLLCIEQGNQKLNI